MVRRAADTVFIPHRGRRFAPAGRHAPCSWRGRQGQHQQCCGAQPSLITEGATRFGSQCIVVAIDARRRQRSDVDAL
ncbi:MAG: hypothetical protein R3A10_14240 [Caldilineaceae bacterium]